MNIGDIRTYSGDRLAVVRKRGDSVNGWDLSLGNMLNGWPLEVGGRTFANLETAYIAGVFSGAGDEAHVRAQEACYGFIPEEETEALAAAADYFETRGSAQQRLDAWYRLGRLQSSEGALYRAVVSFEKALAAAQELQDDGALGEIGLA